MNVIYDKVSGAVKCVTRCDDNNSHIRRYASFRAALIQVEIQATIHRSADEYFFLKDQLRKWTAKSCGISSRQYDPAGAWHGMQSN